jgi:hypothetical protein
VLQLWYTKLSIKLSSHDWCILTGASVILYCGGNELITRYVVPRLVNLTNICARISLVLVSKPALATVSGKSTSDHFLYKCTVLTCQVSARDKCLSHMPVVGMRLYAQRILKETKLNCIGGKDKR